MGYAMHHLHETPVLDRSAVRTALSGATIDTTILPPAIQALSAADLADQVDQIKITPETVSLNAGGREVPGDVTAQTGNLHFTFPALASGAQWLRLRADGADSPLVNRALTPPQFDASQQMTIPA